MSFDQASLQKLRGAYPNLGVRACRLQQDVSDHLGLTVRITEVIRTMEQQAALYARGRTAPGPKVTNAPAGSSIHHYGLAFDICFLGADPYLEQYRKKNGDAEWDRTWRKVGLLAEGHGLTWGFDWNANGIKDANDFDRPHFQITYGQTLKQIQDLYRFGGMAAVWAACDKLRGVEIGSEWNGITTKRELKDAGILA